MAHNITTQEESTLQRPFNACQTNEPYVFVSYAHKDRTKVYPEIERLHKAGYRIWYDQGIKPTKRWRAHIEEVLRGCTFFIVYISSNSVASDNVLDEIELAINIKKDCLPIHLQETTYPDGINMCLSRIQEIHKYNMTDDTYWQQLLDTLPLTTYAPSAPPPSVPTPEQSPIHTPAGIRAHLELISDPPGASVWVDGLDTGKVTPYRYAETLRSAPSRDVIIELKKAGYDDDPFEITLHRGINHPITRTLIDNCCHLHITTTPPGADVTIDHYKLIGVTPYDYHRDLNGSPTCEIDLKLMLPRYEMHRAHVILQCGKTTMYDATLIRLKVRPPRPNLLLPTILPRATAISPEPQLGTIQINPKDGMEMVYVPAGEFLMGSDEYKNEQPPHTVDIDGYWIYKTPVTVAQYRAFCRATGRDMPSAPDWVWRNIHPVVNVNWDDAQAYATWAGATLPTEAQWEKAARGTDGRVYPWGNDWDAGKVQCSKIEVRDAERTAPVGRYPAGASPYGCLDMSGNVWEWCADWYDKDYYQNAPTLNPTGPATGTKRSLRGGSWLYYEPRYFRAAFRYSHAPSFRYCHVGFRCIMRLSGL